MQLYKKHKTPFFYVGSSFIKAISIVIVGFVIAKFISPEDLGLWTTINLAITYSLFMQIGIINGLNLELPFLYGKENKEEAIKIAGTAQTYIIFLSLFLLIIGVLCFLFYPFEDLKIKNGLLAITLVIVFSNYQNYLISTFRSNNSFLKLSYIQFAEVFFNLITLILVVYFSYYGLILKAVLVIFFFTLLLHFYRPIKIGLSWDKPSFKKLLKIGIPIFSLGYFEAVAVTSDKVFLLAYSDLATLGFYAFAFYSLSLFSMFSASVANYVYPRMTFNYGKTGDKLIIWKYVDKITKNLFLIQLPLMCLGIYLIPILVTIYFPKYILSINAMQILLIAGFFKGCAVGVNALWSIKKWKFIILYQATYSIFLISIPLVCLNLFTDKLEGVSYGVLIANFLGLILGLYLTYLSTNEKNSNSTQ